MPSAFANGARTRFVDREQVVAELSHLGEALRQQQRGVRAVVLFGSFHEDRPTPRSDADLAIVLEDGYGAQRDGIRDAATDVFLDAPVPVELFVFTRAELEQAARAGRGPGAAAAAGRDLTAS